MADITVHRINSHIYRLNENDGKGVNVDAYLVIGSQKAVVIDALQDNPDLYDVVKEITDQPMAVLLTHGHSDHAGKSCAKFIEHEIPVYMHPSDKKILDSFEKGAWKEKICDLEDSMIFDLGDYQLETICCAGHTPGSVVFLNQENSELFTGDAIGSGGFWMQLSHCLPLTTYLKNVEQLLKKVENLPDLKLYFGHSEQAICKPTVSYLLDNIQATKMIIQGTLQGEEKKMCLGGEEIDYCQADYKEVYGYCYNPENIQI